MSDTLIVGASGLVGRLVIDHAAGPLTIIARREIADLPRQHRLIVAPPERWADIIASEKPATLISCLGTTIRQAGSQAAFRAVDHDAVLAFATAAQKRGATVFVHVSSLGANASSRQLYASVKGEIEAAVAELGFASVLALRPSILDGDREESRPLERVGLAFARALSPVLGKYKPTSALAVARTMIAKSKEAPPGAHVIDADAIR